MSQKVIDGEKFQKMVASAANSLDSEKTEINNLNVFPVPDGDMPDYSATGIPYPRISAATVLLRSPSAVSPS